MSMLQRVGVLVSFWLAATVFASAQAPSSPTLNEAPRVLQGTGPTANPAADTHAAADAAKNGDGFDVSPFLDKTFGFLPVVSPITEPAIGYGASGGLMFLSKSFGDMSAGLGRPNITYVGGMGTSNGSWAVYGIDARYWLRDHLQTLFVAIYGSLNLDFYGIGKTEALQDDPLRYSLRPIGGTAQVKYRFGDSSIWAGLNARFASTAVEFDSKEGTDLPAYHRASNLGGATAMAVWDSRDNIFTPIRGTYVEGNFGMFLAGPESTGVFEQAELLALQFIPLPFRLYLGLRGQVKATFGEAPFYFLPFISMRGVMQVRYQGEEIAQLEAELRWQFWKRWSLVGFAGGGGAWAQFERFDEAQGVAAGGGGFRYEIARKYGIHAGIDVAGSRDTAAVYIQVGSDWMRP